jgi:integrase/recombinase XerD
MDYIKDFGEHLTSVGKADNTVSSYTGDVKGVIRFLAERDLTFEGTLNRFTIISYKNHLLEQGIAPVTVNKKLNSIQSFNDFLINKEHMTESVINLGRDRIKIAKGSEKPVEVYSPAVVEALLFHLETKAKNLRDKVLVHLLLYTGVRVSELVSIKIRDIDFLGHQLKVVGKGVVIKYSCNMNGFLI